MTSALDAVIRQVQDEGDRRSLAELERITNELREELTQLVYDVRDGDQILVLKRLHNLDVDCGAARWEIERMRRRRPQLKGEPALGREVAGDA